jgi:hypothetical protein
MEKITGIGVSQTFAQQAIAIGSDKPYKRHGERQEQKDRHGRLTESERESKTERKHTRDSRESIGRNYKVYSTYIRGANK